MLGWPFRVDLNQKYPSVKTAKYGRTRRYNIPKFIPAPIPGVPLLKLFSSVERHIAHCAKTDELATITMNTKAKNVFFIFIDNKG
jgi:hypothetical protein